jgi:predicted GIY-YIG superfamily endonuclease
VARIGADRALDYAGTHESVRIMDLADAQFQAWREAYDDTMSKHVSEILKREGVDATRRMSLALPKGAYVYRAYNKYGEILYVGVTGNLFSRMNQHARQSVWWKDAARLEWDEYAKRAWAVKAEADLIYALKPPFNLAGKYRRTVAGSAQAEQVG